MWCVCVLVCVLGCVCVREAAGGGGGGREEARDTESKTRTPHKDVGNQTRNCMFLFEFVGNHTFIDTSI